MSTLNTGIIRRSTVAQINAALDLAMEIGVHVPASVMDDSDAAGDFIAAAMAAKGRFTRRLRSARAAFAAAGLAPPADNSSAAWQGWLTTAFPPPPPDPTAGLLRYWRAALERSDFESISQGDPAGQIPLAALPLLLAGDAELSAQIAARVAGEGSALLWATLGIACEGVRRVEAAALALLWDGSRVHPIAAPLWFNPLLITPRAEASRSPLPVLADIDAVDRAIEALGEVPSDLQPWLAYQQRLVKAATGHDLLLGQAGPDFEVLPQLRLVHHAGADGARALLRTYDKVMSAPSASPLLLALLDEGPATALDADARREARAAITAHMDTYDARERRRQGWPLDPYQRGAAGAAMLLVDGELQAVNGPPGTGKTSFLRAVIASMWANAAAEHTLGHPPPLVIATGATNKAVTNIIQSFAQVPSPAVAPAGDIARRWISAAPPTYGWYAPAHSRVGDSTDQAILLCGGDAGARQPGGVVERLTDQRLGFQQEMTQEWLGHYRTWAGRTDDVPLADAVADLQKALCENLSAQRKMRASLRTLLDAPGIDDEFMASAPAELERRVRALELDVAAADAARADAESHLRRVEVAIAQATSLQADERVPALHQMLVRLLPATWSNRLAARRRRNLAARRDALAALVVELRGHGSTDTPSLADLQQMHRDGEAAVMSWRTEVEVLSSELHQARARLCARAMLESFARQSAPALREVIAYLLEGRARSKEEVEEALEAAIDLEHRIPAFHLAARYWEGAWLLAKPPEEKPLQQLRWWAHLAPVIVATFHTLPRVMGQMVGGADLLIVDEGGQASPEVGSPVFALARRGLVVGDTHQLQPVSSLTPAMEALALRRAGIDLPLSHRLAGGSIMRMAQRATRYAQEGADDAGVTLRRHYRCRPSIIGYCDSLVYGGCLEPVRPPHPAPFVPEMSWVEVSADPMRAAGSVCNAGEVEAIVHWLTQSAGRIMAAYGPLHDAVALITPFRAQADLLREKVGQALGPDTAERMVIGTVHALQGAERPIVAFSMVQGQSGRLFADRDGPNLLNVAVSRAQEAFVLFTHPSAVFDPARRATPAGLLGSYMLAHGVRLFPEITDGATQDGYQELEEGHV